MSARPRERRPERHSTGAERPPLCLWAALKVFLATAVWLCGVAPSASRAGGDCRALRGDVSWVELMDGSNPRGAKLVFNSGWGEARTMHGQWLVYGTPLASDSESGVLGWLRFGLPLPDEMISEEVKTALGLHGASRVETALHPRVLAIAVGFMQGSGNPPDIWAETPVMPARLATVAGFRRVIGAKVGDSAFYGTAVAVDDGCLFMHGVFAAKDGRQLSAHDLDFLNSTIRLERYEPAPFIAAPAAGSGAPLESPRFEDFRRALGLDQVGGKQ
jgi:hypothetical protein